MVAKLYEIWQETTPGILASCGSAFQELDRTDRDAADIKVLNYEVKRAIRTLLAATEAMSGLMTDCIRHVHWIIGSSVPEKVIQRLRAAERRNPASKGAGKYIHMGMDERMKIALKHFAGMFGVQFQPSFGPEWEQLKSLIRIRNGFTHPGTALDLLGARGISILLAPTIWFIEQFGKSIVDCARATGLNVPGELPHGAAATLPKWPVDPKGQAEEFFNEEFNEQVAASPEKSINLLRFYRDVTHYEFLRVLEDLNELERGSEQKDVESRIVVREFVQTVSAAGEAEIGFLQFFLRGAKARGEILVGEDTLRGLGWGDDVAGRLVDTVNLFSQEVGDGTRVATSEGYAHYRSTLAVRDRLTHPRSVKDLFVSDDELGRAKLAWCWLAEVRAIMRIRDSYAFRFP